LNSVVAEKPAIVAELWNRGRPVSGLREVQLKKLFTFISSGRPQMAVAMGLLLQVAEAVAQVPPNGNSPRPTASAIPTLDGVGLATLAGGLAMAGAWAMARARRKK